MITVRFEAFYINEVRDVRFSFEKCIRCLKLNISH